MTKPSKAALWQLFNDRSGQYDVRTRNFDADGNPQFINELVTESSPYLLQHAHNPVDWMAWDAAAFERAKTEKKPIFLSIGYATCHWCHVMEHESFEDLTVAEFLNQHFVCIKVDREQHPVVDDFYMTALQLIAGQGGWPMSSFLTHDAEPFMAGTYFPQPRFLELLYQINDLWQTQPEKLIQQGKRVKSTVSRYLSSGIAEDTVSDQWLNQAAANLSNELLDMCDSRNGGFGGAPKFPQEAWLQFLMYQYLDSQDEKIADALKLNLRKMQLGGIHDHLAGGFHRYCVDEDWLVPHFEKMLYNQAQLLQIYAQASVVFDDDSFAETAKQIVAFVKAEMLSDEGLFCSALDADSINEQGVLVEGAYYVWSWQELKDLLSDAELAWLSTHFAVFPDGNFEGQNVLFQRDLSVIDDQFPGIRNKLKQARVQKVRPLTDDKVIVSWNAMMIEALARAAVLLNEDGLLTLAQKAYHRLWDLHWKEGELWRVSQAGQVHHIPAVLSDYSNLATATLALNDAMSSEPSSPYQQNAEQLLSSIKTKFWHQGALYQSEVGQGERSWHPQVVNAKDGATVSATAKLLQALSISGQNHSGWFDEVIASHVSSIKQQNTAHTGLLTAHILNQNHALGQKTIYKPGLTISLTRLDQEKHQMTCKTELAWLINDMSLKQGVQVIKAGLENDNCIQYILSGSGVFELNWQLCDDQQCLTQQAMNIFIG